MSGSSGIHERPVTTQATVAAPPSTTVFSFGAPTTVTKVGGTAEVFFVIPSTKVAVIQRFEAGAFIPKDDQRLQCKVELFHQPIGTPVGEVLVGTGIYLHGQSFGIKEFIEDSANQFTGDGTARFLVRMTNWSSEDAEVSPFVKGYHDT